MSQNNSSPPSIAEESSQPQPLAESFEIHSNPAADNQSPIAASARLDAVEHALSDLLVVTSKLHSALEDLQARQHQSQSQPAPQASLSIPTADPAPAVGAGVPSLVDGLGNTNPSPLKLSNFNSIQKFTGDESQHGTPALKWLMHFESAITLCGNAALLNDPAGMTKAVVFAFPFNSKAFTWLVSTYKSSTPGSLLSVPPWAQFRKDFIDTFVQLDVVLESYTALLSLWQNQKSLLDFTNDFNHLVSMAIDPNTFERIPDRLLVAMYHKKLNSAVQAIVEVGDLELSLTEFQRVIKRRATLKKLDPPPARSGSKGTGKYARVNAVSAGSGKKYSGPLPSVKYKRPPAEIAKCKAAGECYNCFETGHTSAKCPNSWVAERPNNRA